VKRLSIDMPPADGDAVSGAGNQQCGGGAHRCPSPSLAVAAGTCAGRHEGVDSGALNQPLLAVAQPVAGDLGLRPTDAKLVNRARETLVTLAKKLGVERLR
jgi:hypothetical protein